DSFGILVVAGASFANSQGRFALARYHDDGLVDASFGAHGLITTDFNNGAGIAYGLTVDGNGNLVVAGGTDNGLGALDFAVARYVSGSSAVSLPPAPARVIA